MRISYTQDKENLLKDVDYTAWRFFHCKETRHRKETNKVFQSCPRFRRETRH